MLDVFKKIVTIFIIFFPTHTKSLGKNMQIFVEVYSIQIFTES